MFEHPHLGAFMKEIKLAIQLLELSLLIEQLRNLNILHYKLHRFTKIFVPGGELNVARQLNDLSLHQHQ